MWNCGRYALGSKDDGGDDCGFCKGKGMRDAGDKAYLTILGWRSLDRSAASCMAFRRSRADTRSIHMVLRTYCCVVVAVAIAVAVTVVLLQLGMFCTGSIW